MPVTPLNPAGPRLLLRRMREVMATPQPPQQKLDQMVRVIANNMVAEVCSIYLVRAGDILELFATVGLNPEAVHKTNLRVGEGLIGEIAARLYPNDWDTDGRDLNKIRAQEEAAAAAEDAAATAGAAESTTDKTV